MDITTREQTEKRLKSMLSLCRKAGKLVTGETGCEHALQSRQACLVIICTDASANTKKKFTQKAFYYEVPCYILLKKNELSAAIGLNNRATAVITDKGLGGRIIELTEKLTAACGTEEVRHNNREVDTCQTKQEFI